MNCIVVDIGNTSTVVGIAIDRKVVRIRRVATRTAHRVTISRVVHRLARERRIDGAVISSVVPVATPAWRMELARALGRNPLLVSHRLEFGLQVDYPAPSTLGADRLVNVCGAVQRYGAPVVVADFGTAATFDMVTRDGRFVGGVIAPGPMVMTEYLAERTALLPKIRLGSRYGRVGRSTVGAMLIGTNVGYRGMVRAILDHVLQLRGLEGAKLCATGGWAGWVLKGLGSPFELAPDLTLFGLACVFELNSEKFANARPSFGSRDRRRA